VNLNGAQYLADLFWLLPELWLTLAGFALLLVSPFVKSEAGRRGMAWSSIAVQVVALLLLIPYGLRDGVFGASGPASPGAVFHLFGADAFPLVVVDGFSIVLKGTILIAGILSTLMGIRFLEIEKLGRGEFHAMLLFAILGAMFLVSASDFITLYVGLETMSLSVYLLVGWAKERRKSNEAALKYFLLGSLASGILLYGMSLVYGATRSTNFFGVAQAIAKAGAPGPLLLGGTLLIVVAVGFKMAAAPFHIWSPDAYEGAPTLITAFMSTAVKTAAFGLGLRLFLVAFGSSAIAKEWTLFFAILCALSMTVGNVVAVWQDNMKRLLAYSSIAHAGYALLGLVAIGAALSGNVPAERQADVLRWGQLSVVLYMIAYTVTNCGAFALVVMLRRKQIVGDQVADFAGMARRAPWLAAAMTIFLLSLGGIPATAGFVGKWWLFAAIIDAGYGWLALIAALNSAISLFYYLRVVVKMYMTPPVEDEAPYNLNPALAATVLAAVAAVLVIGLFPNGVLALIEGATVLPH